MTIRLSPFKIFYMYITILNTKKSRVDVVSLDTDNYELIREALKERGYDLDKIQFMVSHDLQIHLL